MWCLGGTVQDKTTHTHCTCIATFDLYMYVHAYCYLFPSSVASWTLTPPEDATGWRHIRIKINGPNASGQTHYLSLSGLEIYGEIRGLADEDLGMCVIQYLQSSHPHPPVYMCMIVTCSVYMYVHFNQTYCTHMYNVSTCL